MDGRQRVRNFLGIDERTPVIEIGVFGTASSDAGDVDTPEEKVLEDLETDPEMEDREPGIDVEDLVLADVETEPMSEDVAIEGVLPVGRVRRSDLDARILVVDDIPDASVAEGAVVRGADGTWILDTRGQLEALLFIGRPPLGHALLAHHGIVRIYAVGGDEDVRRPIARSRPHP